MHDNLAPIRVTPIVMGEDRAVPFRTTLSGRSAIMTNLTSRVEFRLILKRLADCLNESLPAPLAPLTSEQMLFWLREITAEDLRAVLREEPSQQ